MYVTPLRQDAQNLNMHLATLLAALLLFVSPAIAAKPSATAARHTVAIYTYHFANQQLRPSNVFSGVAVNSKTIITSGHALTLGHSNPFINKTITPPASIVAVFSDGKEQFITNCSIPLKSISKLKSQSIIAITIDPKDQETVAKWIAGDAVIAPIAADSPASITGIIAAIGPKKTDLPKTRIPAPIALSQTPSEASSAFIIKSFTVAKPLANNLLGAGLWSANDNLIGIVTQSAGQVALTDLPAAITVYELALKASTKVAPTLNAKLPVISVTPSVIHRPDSPPELADFKKLMKAEGFNLTISHELVDHVNQDQADLVMAHIAGGKHKDAIDIIVEIAPLVAGTLKEQLTYRHALALTLTGDFKKAAQQVKVGLTAKDPLVAARSKALNMALSAYPDGKYEEASLSDDKTLTTAIAAQLSKVHWGALEKTASLIRSAPGSHDAFVKTWEELDSIDKNLSDHTLCSPSYFDAAKDTILKVRTALSAIEYPRARAELESLHQAYESLKDNAQYKEKSKAFEKPGYWPASAVEEANKAIMDLNNRLSRYRMIEKFIPEGDRKPLPVEQSKPLPPLPLAVPGGK